MAGISLMAPFVATIIASASPYAETKSPVPSCEPIAEAPLSGNDQPPAGAMVPHAAVSETSPPTVLRRTIRDRYDGPTTRICSNC